MSDPARPPGSQSRSPGWRAEGPALLALAAAVVIVFWPFVTMRQVFYQVDLAFMDHPLRAHAFDHVRRGEFPYWCPHLLAGFPLFAEGQAALLYPPSWLYLALSREAALNASVVLHYLLLAFSTYAWLRGRMGRAGALLGATTLTFSSFALVMHVLPGFLAVIAWTPVALWSGERFAASGARRWLALAAAAVAAMHFAGDPLGTWLAAVLFAGWVAAGVSLRARRRMLALVVPLGLGTALAAIQLVPTAGFLEASTRSGERATGPPAGQFVPAAAAATAWSPRFHGERFSEYRGPQSLVWEESLLFFTGFSTLLLVPFGVGRDRGGLFWSVAALASLSFCSREAYGLTGALWQWPPFVLFRWPAHALLWYSVAVAVLAGRGLDRLLSERAPASAPWRWRLAAGLVATGLVLTLGLAAPDPALAAARRADAIVLVASAAVAALALRLRPRLGSPGVAAAFFTILAAGLWLAPGPEGLPADVYSRAQANIARLEPMLGADGRFLALRDWEQPTRPQDAASFGDVARAAPANLHLLAGLAAVGQFDLAHTATLWRSQAALVQPGPRLLELLGLELVVGAGSSPPRDPWAERPGPAYAPCRPGPPVLWCREAPLSRAFLAREYEVTSASGALEGIRRAEGPDPRRVVALEQEPHWPASASAPAAIDQVVVVGRSATGVELEIAARERALLVLAEAWAEGWRARLDGEEVAVLAAHGFVRAVAVPAGHHRLAFRYEPASSSAGAWISGAAAGLWLLLVASRGRTS